MKKEEKNKFQNKSKNSEIEVAEEIIISSEETADEILEIEQEEQEDEIENVPEHIIEEIAQPETKPVPENSEASNKLKIKALKRAVENKKYSIEREEIKVKDWRVQAVDRDKKATDEYEKRKNELETLLSKNQERFDKRMKKTKIWWWDYCVNHENVKIKKLTDDLELLQNELLKFEELETKETK